MPSAGKQKVKVKLILDFKSSDVMLGAYTRNELDSNKEERDIAVGLSPLRNNRMLIQSAKTVDRFKH